jgi:hypothetical protein
MRSIRLWPWWFWLLGLIGWSGLLVLTLHFQTTVRLQGLMIRWYRSFEYPLPGWFRPDLHLHVMAGTFITWWLLMVSGWHQRAGHWAPAWAALVLAVLIVSAEEGLQVLRPERTGSWLDWSASLSGVLYGFLVWWFGKMLFKERSTSEPQAAHSDISSDCSAE